VLVPVEISLIDRTRQYANETSDKAGDEYSGLYYNHRVLSSGEECARVHVAVVGFGFGFGFGKFSVFLFINTLISINFVIFNTKKKFY